jgi:hypothetical protein
MSISDEKLDQLLKSVKPVPPSSNLAERIIAQATISTVAVRLESRNKSLFKQLLNSFIVPKPAFALACSMVVGVLLGWQTSELEMNINTIQLASMDEDLSSLFITEVNFYD